MNSVALFRFAREAARANRLFAMPATTRLQARLFSADAATMPVRHESGKQRFTAELNGNYARLDYHIKDNVITFIHTEVPEVFRGKGVGKVLAQEAFKHAQNNNFKVQIECDYLWKYYTENRPQYQPLMLVDSLMKTPKL